MNEKDGLKVLDKNLRLVYEQQTEILEEIKKIKQEVETLTLDFEQINYNVTLLVGELC